MSASRHRWSCIAYAFPPVNRSGTHRTLGFVRHLAEMGWGATVLTVEPSGEAVDAELLTQVPPGTRIIRTPCVDRVKVLKSLLGQNVEESKSQTVATAGRSRKASGHNKGLRDWFSRLLQLPDSRSGWIGPAVRAGYEAICDDTPEVLYSTSPCMSAHLIARTLKRHTGLPWVADFRDPWRDNPFRSLGYRSLDWLDARLERGVLRSADRIILNTPTARDALLARCPDLSPKCAVILNGFDADSFDALAPHRTERPDTFVLAHAGQFYGARSPLPLFQALQAALQRQPGLRNRLRLELIGTRAFEGTPLAELAARAHAGHVVNVVGPLPHRETLARLAGADALLLAGSTGPGADLQIPAKFYEYLALRRPILALLSAKHPARELLTNARVPSLVVSSDDVGEIENALITLATGGLPCPADAWSRVEQFTRRNRTEELRRMLETVVLRKDVFHEMPASRELQTA